MSMSLLNEAIKNVRSVAQRQAKEDYPCVSSRGIQLYVMVNGNRCDEAIVDKSKPLTKKDVAELVLVYNQQIAMGNTVEMWACGGYNGAETVQDLCDGMVDPWISEWDVELVPYKDIVEVRECEADVEILERD